MSSVWYKISAKAIDANTVASNPLIGYVDKSDLPNKIATALHAHLGVEAIVEPVPAPPPERVVVTQVLVSLFQENGHRRVTSSIVHLLPHKRTTDGVNVKTILAHNRPASIPLEVWRFAGTWTSWSGVHTAPHPCKAKVHSTLADLSTQIAAAARPVKNTEVPLRMTHMVVHGPHVECTYVIPWNGKYEQEVSAIVPLESVTRWIGMILNLGGTIVSQVPVRDGELVWVRKERPNDWLKLGAYYGRRVRQKGL